MAIGEVWLICEGGHVSYEYSGYCVNFACSSDSDSFFIKLFTNQLESQQVRALRIIFGDKSYEEALDFTGLQTLEDRRESIAWKMFMSILHPDNCLNKLLPDIRNQDSISRLRVARSYPEQNVLKNPFPQRHI